MATFRLTPSQVGIENVNLKVTDDHNGNVLDVRDAFAFTAIVAITETGSPSAGAADLIVDIMTRDGVTETFSHTIDTGIDIQTNGLKEGVVWGHGLTARAVCIGGTAGTISTTPEILNNVDFMRLNLKASTANNGTTCTGSVTLLLEKA